MEGTPLLARVKSTRQTRCASATLRETPSVTRHFRSLCLIVLAAGSSVRADSVNVISGTLGGTSDFVFRGISITRGKPAAQASIDVEFPKEFYVGGFIATADPNRGPSPNYEFDAWAGKYWRISENFSGDVRLSQYTYPGDPRHVNYDRTEITGTLGFRNQLFVAAIYSPNTAAVGPSPGYDKGSAWALELSGRMPIDDRFSVSGGVGHYGLGEIYHDSYNYWNATLIANLAPFELQLAYLGVDKKAEEHFPRRSVGDRVAFTVLWRFSSSN